MADRLGVWLNGVQVANIERHRRNDTRLRLRYTDEALDRWPLNAPLVSCSLPLSGRPADAVPFLRGLLPEGSALAVLAAQAGVSAIDTLELLDRYGRDVAGALVISREPPDQRRFGLAEYADDEHLGDEVAALDRNPLGSHDDSELSLAGLQNKLLLVKTRSGWARPLHGRPSTHILKAEDRRFPGLAQAEADCLGLARQVGLTPVRAEVRLLAGIPCLITERYDRSVAADGRVSRMHQEDLCQAVGIDGADNRGRAKYQRRGGGGPGWREAALLLEAHAEDAVGALTQLVSALTFTVAIGNADAHAKNLSFLHDTPTTIELAPLYDTTPTMLWPSLAPESALSVNGRHLLERLTLDDILAEAASWPWESSTAGETAVQTLRRLREAADTLGSDRLATLVVARCEALLDGKPAGALRER